MDIHFIHIQNTSNLEQTVSEMQTHLIPCYFLVCDLSVMFLSGPEMNLIQVDVLTTYTGSV